MHPLRGILLPGLLVCALAGHGQDRLALLDQKHGDTLRLDPARVLEVRSDSLWLHGALAAWDAEHLMVRMKRYHGQYLVDTLLAVPRSEVRELVVCQLKDQGACATFDQREDKRDTWINKGTCAVVLVGGLLLLFGDEGTAQAGAAIAIGGGILIYGGGHLLGGRDTKRFKMGKRWKLL